MTPEAFLVRYRRWILPGSIAVAFLLSIGGGFVALVNKDKSGSLIPPESTPADLAGGAEDILSLTQTPESILKSNSAVGGKGSGWCRDVFGKIYHPGDPPTEHTHSSCTQSGWRVPIPEELDDDGSRDGYLWPGHDLYKP